MAIKKIVIFHRHVSLPKGKSEKKKTSEMGSWKSGVIHWFYHVLRELCWWNPRFSSSIVYPGFGRLEDKALMVTMATVYGGCTPTAYGDTFLVEFQECSDLTPHQEIGQALVPKKTTSAAVMTCTSCIRRCIRKSLRVCNGITPLLIIWC